VLLSTLCDIMSLYFMGFYPVPPSDVCTVPTGNLLNIKDKHGDQSQLNITKLIHESEKITVGVS
jgi:hypothetical protein